MLQNYLKIAVRTLRRHAGHTFINVVGLAVGLACVLLIGLFVRNELSYDRIYPNADRIYRVMHTETAEDGAEHSARSPVPMGPALADEVPEATDVVRFWRSFQATLGHEERVFQEPGLYFADPAVFEVFSLDLLRGDPQAALTAPHTIVLTETAAQRYFGDADPMGRVLDYDGYPGADSLQFTVTGILPDLPENTHLAFTALASLDGIETERDNWGSYKPIWTYVLLPASTSPERLEAKLPGFVERYLGDDNTQVTMHLEPITDIHLYSRYEGGFKSGSTVTYVYLFAAIGLFILLLACVNFINLSTARSLKRAREVGMRKVLGAQRGQLVGQFLGEAFLVTGLAVLLAAVLVDVLLPVFNALFGTALTIELARDGALLLALPVLVLLVGLLAGLYPAFVLSRFRPAITLSGRLAKGASGAGLRQGLVVFQFAVSTILIAGTLVVEQQLDYLRSKDLGFDREQVVVLPHSSNEEPLLAALRQHPDVVSASVSQRVPVNTIGSDGRPVLPEGFQETVGVDSYIIDDAFLETFGMELVAGRALSEERSTDAKAFLINETAVRRFGWGTPQEALGKELHWHDEAGPVVGVVNDFPVASMHEAITPVVLQMRPGEQWWRTFISVKIRPQDVSGTLAFLEDTWRAHTPGGAYEYFFLDESFEALHRADARFGQIFGAFATLAIVIACLGLFGLAAFMAEQRTKEIGVRKVLGASVPGLVALLSKDFVRLVAVAFVVAVPVAYLAMDRWLADFAYRVDLGVGVFALAGGLALAIALATVCYQAIRAALADPVESLRYE